MGKLVDLNMTNKAEILIKQEDNWVNIPFKDLQKGDIFITSNDNFENVWESISEVYTDEKGILTVNADCKGKNGKN